MTMRLLFFLITFFANVSLAMAAYVPDKTLVVGSELDFPPFAVGNTDETASGFTVDLWKEVAKEAGLKYSIRVRPWAQILQEFKEGKVDVLINIAQSEDRHNYTAFSVPHDTVHGAIFVRKNDSRIHSEADLANKSIIVFKSDLAHEYALSHGLQKQLVVVETAKDGLKLLASGKCDAMLLSKLVGMQTLNELNTDTIIPLHAKVGYSQKFSFGTHKHDSQLLAHINEALALTKTNGSYDALYAKWFGVYEVKEPTFRDSLKYIAPFLLISLFVTIYNVRKRRLERINAESRLNKKRLKYQSLFENMTDGFASADMAGNILICNKAFCEMIGYSSEELSKLSYLEITPERWHAEEKKILDEHVLVHGHSPVYEKEYYRKEGTLLTVELRTYLSEDEIGKPVGMWAIVRDISERKRAEEALRESEYFFKESQRAAFIGSYKADFMADKWESSDVLDTIFGIDNNYTRDAQGWLDIVHPDDRAMIDLYLREDVIAKKNPFCKKYRIIRKNDGEMRWVHCLGEVKSDHQGNPVSLIGTIQDVTDQIQAQLMLHLSEERQRILTTTMLHGVVYQNADGTITSMNPAAEKILGWNQEEFLGSSSVKVQHQTIRENGQPFPGEEHPAMVALRTGLTVSSVVMGVFNQKLNEYRWISIGAVPVFRPHEARPFEVFTVFEDITERKHNELELLKLSRAVQQSPVSIMITDTVGSIEFVNQKFTELTGYTAEEAIFLNASELDSGLTPPDSIADMRATIANNEVWEGEFHNKAKDGRLFWEHAKISALCDDSGAVTHYIAVKQDITDKKNMLEELTSAKIKAEAATEAKSFFLSNMTHEIRTPMNGIIGMSSVLMESGLTPVQLEYAEIISRSGESLLVLINDILDFSKIESGKLELEHIDFNLQQILDDINHLLAYRVDDAGLILSYHIEPAVPTLLNGDPGRLRQIITNLVGNAIKFTRKGSVTVTVSLVSDQDGIAIITFSITDTGIGIPASRISALFSPFTQVDSSTTRKYGGTGLGLAISKQLAELMGGEIGVVSEEGKCSTFWFTTRLEKQNVESCNVKMGTTNQLQGNIFTSDKVRENLTARILLAEDNPVNQKVALHMLKTIGLSVDTVADGQQAIDALSQVAYDLVLKPACQAPAKIDG